MSLCDATIINMEEKEFNEQVQSLIAVKSEKLKNLSEEAKRYWKEIDEGTLHFKRQDLEVEELKKLTKQDLLEFSKSQFDANSKDRRKLSIRVISTKAEAVKSLCIVVQAESATSQAVSEYIDRYPQLGTVAKKSKRRSKE